MRRLLPLLLLAFAAFTLPAAADDSPDVRTLMTPEEYNAAGLEKITFSWAGGFDRSKATYYRIQGPRLLAEYDNTTRDGNHVHTEWRDPVNDFGGMPDVLGDHRRHGH